MLESVLSNLSSKNLKVLYWVLRGFTLLCGIFWMFGLVARFLMPALYYDEGPVPSLRYQVVDSMKDVMLSILLLLPNRWTIKAPFFQLRLGFLTLFVLWILFVSVSGLAGYIGGRKHWAILPALLVMLFFAGSTIVTLLMKRYLRQDNQAEENS